MPPPLQVDNVFVFSRQVEPIPGFRHVGSFFDISNKLTFDLLTLKLVSESRVTLATSMPVLVLLGLSVLELGPMYSTNRRQTKASLNLMPPPYGAEAIIIDY